MPTDPNQILFPAVMALLALTAISGLWWFFGSFFSQKRLTRSLNMALLFIALPKASTNEKEKKNFKELISVMEQFYTSLSNFREKGMKTFLYGRPTLSMEMAVQHVGEEICFYLACPRRFVDILEKQIHGFFPAADVRLADDFNIFNPQGVSLGSSLVLYRDRVLPIRTYQLMEADPLNEILNTMSKLQAEGEGAAIQLLFRPVKNKWRKRALKIAREMQQGKAYDKAKIKLELPWFFKVLNAVDKIISSEKPREQQALQNMPAKPITPLDQEMIKALESKASKTTFEVNINLLASAPGQAQAEQILAQLENSFAQFNSQHLNSFRSYRMKGRSLKRFFYNFSFRAFDASRRFIFSTEELSSVFHFPTTEIEAPKVKFVKSKQSSPPVNLPATGLVLGKNIFRGAETEIKLEKSDRRRHLYIVGQTGTGKTSLMKSLVAQDILAGEGVGIIDPHGEFAQYALGLVPRERAEDVIYIDPADLERPLGLNMLEYDARNPEQKTFIVNELINIFDKLYDLKTTGGPMFEQYTRNALMLLMDDSLEGATLMDVPRVLADSAFRRRLLEKCTNIVVKDFWEKEAEKAGGEAALANIVPYVTSKFNVFIANDFMRPIIGQSKSSLNFREIMDKKKILLVNLSKGRLGDINSHLLGMIIVGKLTMASFARIDMPEEMRPDFYLYIDEFQNFTTESISTILSEARKYRLCLTIAHQFIKQIPEKIRDAVFGNVGSIISYRVGAEDAEFLVKQFTPVFDQNDLINIDNFNAYAKLLINNMTSKPFNLFAPRPPQENKEMVENLKELSRLKFGRDRATVEKEIEARYKKVEG